MEANLWDLLCVREKFTRHENSRFPAEQKRRVKLLSFPF